MGLSDQEIIEWKHDRSMAKNIAADLATTIRSGRLRPWDPLPDNYDLARKWDASTSTVLRAKKMLYVRGLLRIAGTRYCVQGEKAV